MSVCATCEVLPAKLPSSGVLFVATPLTETQASLQNYLLSSGFAFAELASGTLTIDISEGVMQRLSTELPTLLSSVELEDTRVVMLPAGATPSLADFAKVQPLNKQLARARGDWLIDLLNEQRITSYFQPIVQSSDPEHVFAYECLLRGFDSQGTLIPAYEIFDAARDSGLLFYLDRAARLSAINQAAIHHIDCNIFVNFNPTSIYNPTACLQSTMAAINKANIAPERLIFEVVESEDVADVRHLLRILDFYRAQNFRVALDDLGSGYGSLNLLSELRPDFVKLDIKLIRNVDQDAYKAEVAAKLLEMARNLGAKTVAEGVETEGEWRWVTEHGADLVQGYYFGKPNSEPIKSRVAVAH